MTQKDVADALGISQSYISRLEKKIISDLRIQIKFEKNSKKLLQNVLVCVIIICNVNYFAKK